MAKAIHKIAMNAAENIPYDKLILSQKNVRRVKDGVSFEQLARDIGRRKLLQSLNVRPVLDESGKETGTFEVPAGGRRFLALGVLIEQKRLARNEPIPCIVNRGAAPRLKRTRSPRTFTARTCIRSISSERSRPCPTRASILRKSPPAFSCRPRR